MIDCGNSRWNSFSSCSERRKLCSSTGRGGSGASGELAERVEGVAADDEVAVGEAGDHGLVPGAVAGGVGEPDRPVPEEVEGAAEGGIGADVAPVEVDRAIVECVVEVGGPVAAQQGPAAVGSRPPTRPRRRRRWTGGTPRSPRLWSRWRWVMITIGTSPASSPLARSWAGTSCAGLEARLGVSGRRRAEVLLGVAGDRGMKAGVDEDRAGAGVADQEGRDRYLVGRLAGHHGPHQPQRQEAAAGALHQRQRASSRVPAIIGSTITVAPSLPPASGSCSGLGSAWMLHRAPTVAARSPPVGLRAPWLNALFRGSSRPGCSTGQVCVVSGAGNGPRAGDRPGDGRPRGDGDRLRPARRAAGRDRGRSRGPAGVVRASSRSTSATRRAVGRVRRRRRSSATVGSTSSSTTPAASSSARPRRSRRRAFAP